MVLHVSLLHLFSTVMGKYAWRNIARPSKNQNPSGTDVLAFFLKELEGTAGNLL